MEKNIHRIKQQLVHSLAEDMFKCKFNHKPEHDPNNPTAQNNDHQTKLIQGPIK